MIKYLEAAIKRAHDRLMKRHQPPERVDKITEIAESAEVAAHLLDTPFYKRLVSQIEGEMIEQLLNTPVEDKKTQQAILTGLRINRRYQEFILRVAEKGQWAEGELRRINEDTAE